jgi:DNA-binding GntR family transcriptional regulator
VRRALDVLEEEGRIWRKQGKGTFIGPAAPLNRWRFRDWFSKPTFWK